MRRFRFKLIAALFAVVLLASGCHQSWQSANGIWYLASNECFDRTSALLIRNAPYQPSEIYATTGYFSANANGCYPNGRPYSTMAVTTELYLVNSGLCGSLYTWNYNEEGHWFIDHLHTIIPFCGTGNYFAGTHHRVQSVTNAWHHHDTISPADYYNDGST